MSELEKKERDPRKGATSSAKDPEKAVKKKQTPPVKDQQSDSDDIERAVYDGMQDLREEKSK